MMPRRKEENKPVESCSDQRDNDVTAETGDTSGNISSETSDHDAGMLPNSKLANRIFVGNISYRVSPNAVEVVISKFDLFI